MQHKKRVKGRKLKVKNIGVATLLTITISLSTATAQTSTNATGGDASGSGGSASYSVGQLVFATNIGTNASVAQGVQQPYEISVITAIEEAKGTSLSVSAYPNPTTDYLKLKVDVELSRSMIYQLYDMNGKLLQCENLNGTETKINMSNYVPSTYFVKVVHENKELKTFKIIKTQ